MSFTVEEKKEIQQADIKCILPNIDLSQREGGKESFLYEYEISDMIQNYDDAYYTSTTDSVFLLDIKELKDYVIGRGWEYRKKPTQEAINLSEYDYEGLTDDGFWYCWLRTPVAESDSGVRRIRRDGNINGYDAADSSVGIAPALYLNKEVKVKEGSGTYENPYTIIMNL